jgi:hypothetical protein
MAQVNGSKTKKLVVTLRSEIVIDENFNFEGVQQALECLQSYGSGEIVDVEVVK